jgi:hypothetical protein
LLFFAVFRILKTGLDVALNDEHCVLVHLSVGHAQDYSICDVDPKKGIDMCHYSHCLAEREGKSSPFESRFLVCWKEDVGEVEKMEVPLVSLLNPNI